MASGSECPSCGAQLKGRALICPTCGRLLDGRAVAHSAAICTAQPVLGAREADSDGVGDHRMEGGGAEGDGDAKPAKRGGCMRSATVLLLAGTVLMLIVGLAVAAVYYGLKDRSAIILQTAEEHYDKGVAHAAQREYELSIAEFELALQLRPEYTEAASALTEARTALSSRPTPTPVVRQALNATYYHDLESAYVAGDWNQALSLADRLWSIDPDYRRNDVEGMLYDCYYQIGLRYVDEDRMVEAIRLFDRALQLRPGDADAQREMALASLYMEGMTFWGANWEKVLSSLSQLYEMAPGYHDVADRVYTAAVTYADLFAEQADWCVAVTQYDRALAIYSDANVAARRQECLGLCLAEPSPTPEGTPGPEGWPTPAGPFTGRVVEQTPIASDKIYVRGHVLDAAGRGVAGAVVRIQAWDWFVTHETDANGVFAFDGLDQPVTYTVSLVNFDGASVEAACEWGRITWVEFRESR